MSHTKLPELQVGGKPIDPHHSTSSKPPGEHSSHYYELGKVIRKNMLREKSIKHRFLPPGRLREILTRENVIKELKRCGKGVDAEELWLKISGEEPHDSESEFYIMFALLAMTDHGVEIGNFIQDQITDAMLPLDIDENFNLGKKGQDGNEFTQFKYFKHWTTAAVESFQDLYWRLNVPFLAPERDSLLAPDKPTSSFKAKHYIFEDGVILPWSEIDSSLKRLTRSSEGGYGTVRLRVIEPECHGFGAILKELKLKPDIFALKKLKKPGPDESGERRRAYENEIAQLKRFNGRNHRHLVTLLASFERRQRYYLLFPYAEMSLEIYMKKKTFDAHNIDSLLWLSEQLFGLVEATHTIHNPPHLVHIYGRHGDLKPDNILCYERDNGKGPILVISDMGFTDCHGTKSRSEIPNDKIPRTPVYRPPECDIIGAKISRAWDIWTLGCLFLDLITWSIGGKEWVREFFEQRLAAVGHGRFRSDVYYTIMEHRPENDVNEDPDGKTPHAMKVKEAVTNWFIKIRTNGRCSQFLKDVVDTIEDDMMIVLGKDKKRKRANDLMTKFDKFRKKCNESDSYCVAHVQPSDEGKTILPVRVYLNNDARDSIDKSKQGLQVYTGKVSQSMTEDEIKNF